MTIQSENRKSGPFYGNGRVSRFPFDFKVFDKSDLRVTVRTGDSERNLLHGSDYEVFLQADQEMEPGGEVLLKTPLSDGARLVITSAIPYLQLAKFTNQGGFYPAVLNDSLDRLTIFTQQILQQMQYMPRFGATMDEAVDTGLPFPAPNHGIGWNETGTRLINTRYHIEAEQSAAAAAESANRSQASAVQAKSAQAAAHQSVADAQVSASHASGSREAAEDAASDAAQKADRVAGMAEEINQKFPAMRAYAEEAKRSATEAGTDSRRARAAADLAQSLANSHAANLNAIRLGNGRNNNYQEVLFGNYQRTPGNGNYGGIFNGKFAGGQARWTTIATFGEDGNHISSLFADATKAYVRINSTNHELITATTTQNIPGLKTFGWIIKAKTVVSGQTYMGNFGVTAGHTFIQNQTANAYLAIRNNGDAVFMPNGTTFHRLYHEGNKPAFGDLQNRPSTLAGYGITDAASRTDVAQAAPPGTVMYFAGQTAPAGWLKANGAAVSRTTYAPLFAAIGTRYGAGDNRTTFNLPDLRGEFVRGWDDGRRVDAGRVLGSFQGSQIGYHAHFLANSQLGGQGNVSGGLDSNTFVSAHGLHRAVNNNTANVGITSFNGGRENQDETRPRNVALLACIKI